MDETGHEYRAPSAPRVSWEDQPRRKDGFVFTELAVPRRPAWDETTTPQELDKREKESFLDWRRAIAAKEEELADGVVRVTPFEKNLEVWRQLWRVVERCSCVLQLVDARNPLFYLSSDLRTYTTVELGKPMLLLINKSDFLSAEQRRSWHEYFVSQGWDHLFFSAHIEQEKLDRAAAESRNEVKVLNPLEDPSQEEQSEDDGTEPTQNETETPISMESIGIDQPLTRGELLAWLKNFAVKYDCERDIRYENRIQFGMVGFPNVGKSSVINVLVGSSKHAHGVVRVGVAAQPGKTKHFQTLLLPDRDDMMLCDCPGLVFPSFVSSTADLIAAGVYPISQMRDHWPVVELICQRIPREILNAQYGIQIPVKTNPLHPDDIPTPTAEELLETYCIARSMLAAASGVPDFQRAARLVIKDYADGKLLYCHAPPTADPEQFHRETIVTALTRTKKLREKFGSVLVQQERQSQDASTPVGRELNIDEQEEDIDILDALEGMNSVDDSAKGGKRGKKHKSMKKWGKKGRKDRNKDPYGCHADADDALTGPRSGNGVIVNAGKYGRKGYTRPTGYGGAKGVQ